jgi:hypothetical protein
MDKHPQKTTNMKETLLYGCKIGNPSYMEEILYQCKGWVNKEELMAKGEIWANKNGYDRLRISVIDLSTHPDFIGAIKK